MPAQSRTAGQTLQIPHIQLLAALRSSQPELSWPKTPPPSPGSGERKMALIKLNTLIRLNIRPLEATGRRLNAGRPGTRCGRECRLLCAESPIWQPRPDVQRGPRLDTRPSCHRGSNKVADRVVNLSIMISFNQCIDDSGSTIRTSNLPSGRRHSILPTSGVPRQWSA